MTSKPPQLTSYHAAAFQLQSVVGAYHLRPPYPPELIDALLDLDRGARGPVLEVGCGTGELARALAPRVSRIDAVDISAPMLERARGMPGGDAPSIRWIESAAESFAADGPYSLVVSGDALHWMDWDVVVPAIQQALAPGGRLVLASAGEAPAAWRDAARAAIGRHSAMVDYRDFSLPDELAAHGWFELDGHAEFGPVAYERTIEEYLAAFHARSGLTRERMPDPEGFDRELNAILEPHARDGRLALGALGRLWWSKPRSWRAR